jgi:hypothetical protein
VGKGAVRVYMTHRSTRADIDYDLERYLRITWIYFFRKIIKKREEEVACYT